MQSDLGLEDRATRDTGLRMLDAFAPRMGRRYASGRNYDLGSGRHKSVSQLSPYIRRRLVTEEEAVKVAVEAHGLEGAEKFIQEVFWRSYFKGWLERRPATWTAYRDGLDADLAEVDADRRLAKRLASAEEGRSGIDCFDHWVTELVETGYLHNHARMWFASIWIFTLRLPWRLGADFFYRHLLDGDAASNTLSWRWVAGLHTKGKTYQARGWNIAKFTQQRFHPPESQLSDDAEALVEDMPVPDPMPLRQLRRLDPGMPTALLLTDEDCCIEDFGLDNGQLVAAGCLPTSTLRSPRPVADHVVAFEADALADTVKRAIPVGVEQSTVGLQPADLARWATRVGARQIVTPFVTVGPLADWMAEAKPTLDAESIRLVELRRPWDEAVWPHATAGFFKVKKKIAAILADLDQPRLPLSNLDTAV